MRKSFTEAQNTEKEEEKRGLTMNFANGREKRQEDMTKINWINIKNGLYW